LDSPGFLPEAADVPGPTDFLLIPFSSVGADGLTSGGGLATLTSVPLLQPNDNVMRNAHNVAMTKHLKIRINSLSLDRARQIQALTALSGSAWPTNQSVDEKEAGDKVSTQTSCRR
jgi:hypothetical protein